MPGDSIGGQALVTVNPSTNYVKVRSELKTVPESLPDRINIYREAETNLIHILGQISKKSKGKKYEIAVRDPALFAGFLFKELAESQGIRIYGYAKRINPVDSSFSLNETQLDSVVSPALSEIVKETNRESKNMYAENILKTVGYYVGGDGSYWTGAALVKKFLNQIGVDTSAIQPVDGSGLSRDNLLSPYSIVLTLRYLYLSPYRDMFRESLPKPNEGTLFGRLLKLGDAVRAKTGTLRWTMCISGYVDSPATNDIYAFSILFNNCVNSTKAMQKLQERIIEAISE